MSHKKQSGYSSRSITVTGARGYIGSLLSNYLVNAGASVKKISRNRDNTGNDDGYEFEDLTSFETWLKIVDYSDVIFHLASNTSVYFAENQPEKSICSSLLPIINYINASKSLNKKPRFVLASTVTVYGMTEQLPVSEQHRLHPVTNYDLHKMFAEQQLILSTTKGEVEGVVLRLANVYGPSINSSFSKDRGVLNKITAMALEGNDIKLYGDGKYIRDYVYIDDVVKAFMLAGDNKEMVGKAFNVASGKGITLLDVFTIIKDTVNAFTGNNVKIINVPLPENLDLIEKRNFIADIELIKYYGWYPNHTIIDGINKLIKSSI